MQGRASEPPVNTVNTVFTLAVLASFYADSGGHFRPPLRRNSQIGAGEHYCGQAQGASPCKDRASVREGQARRVRIDLPESFYQQVTPRSSRPG